MSYAAAERRALQALAMEVLADGTTSLRDRAQAHARLMADTRAADLSRLSTAELRALRDAMSTVSRLLGIARGDERDAEPVPMPASPEPASPEPAELATTLPEQLAALAVDRSPEPQSYTLAGLGLVHR